MLLLDEDGEGVFAGLEILVEGEGRRDAERVRDALARAVREL